MDQYDHKKIEKKWQTFWEKKKIFQAGGDEGKKFYALIEFPYPSGDGLHVGHIRSNTAMDVISHKRRREGYNVMYPIGWDAFGLPTENYAIKTGIHPTVVTKQNTDTFRRQLKSIGFSFDWSREINTSDPDYYKWTQWIFLQLLKNDLAYKKKMSINWCPKDMIGLANEEVVDGKCERCGTQVEKREKEQWMLAITKYADRLDRDLDLVDFLPQIKTQQKNWIGRSEGVNFKCKIKDLGLAVEMYNSVPQTYRAETFTVISPEHPLVRELVKGTEHEKPVTDFVERIKQKKLEEKFDINFDPDGIFTGRYIENYAGTGRDLPIWVASYVVMDYGTGIVNASTHDERDFVFAKKYNIPLHSVAEHLQKETTGTDAVRADLPFVERDAVMCIVKHWSEDKYLCLSTKAVDWKGFVFGGIEKGEDIAVAAIREVVEETGYKNSEVIKILKEKTHAQFYHLVKKENRFGHFTTVLMKLKNGEQAEINATEKALHDMHWRTPKEIPAFINREGLHVAWNKAMGTDKPVIKNGIMTEPPEFAGREWSEVREDIIDYLVKKGFATRKVNYKLRDWVFSRQRYWGEPIPVIICDKCGIVPVPEKDLPVELPNVKNYKPTETGESPLASITKWVNVKCPKCRSGAHRETDTMPNWAGSSWYYLRYADPKNSHAFASAENLKYWTPVDWYNGGMEHTTLHLLYSRFWHKFLFDIGVVPTKEPYAKRTSHGLILAKGGEKMSKSKGNVINPDSIIESVGADSLRLYEMFMGPFDQAIGWDENGIVGCRRFLERVWKLQEKIQPSEKIDVAQKCDVTLDTLIHKTIKKVSEDIESMHFNTAVSSLMIAVNALERATVSSEHYEIILHLLAPFAPHMTEEIWQQLYKKSSTKSVSLHLAPWPTYDPQKIKEATVTIAIQINGKTRATIQVATDIAEEKIKSMALSLAEIKKWLTESPAVAPAQKTIQKTIYVKNRLFNIVLG